MGSFLVRRVLFAATLVVAVSVIAFCIFGISFDPGFNFYAAGSPEGIRAHKILDEHYHLKDPILSRYWRWAKGVISSRSFGKTVSTDIGGTPMHIQSEGEPITPIVLQRGVGYLGAAVPTFLIADLLRRWMLPHSSVVFRNGQYEVESTSTWLQPGPPHHGVASWTQHLVLPTFALALGLVGLYARYIRSSMLVSLNQPYVTVARAKGLPERRVYTRHALRNSFIPFTAVLSLEMGAVIGASLAADGVFGAGGLASAFLRAVGNADPFLLTAIFTTIAILVVGFAFLGDLVIGALDPRLRAATP